MRALYVCNTKKNKVKSTLQLRRARERIHFGLEFFFSLHFHSNRTKMFGIQVVH